MECKTDVFYFTEFKFEPTPIYESPKGKLNQPNTAKTLVFFYFLKLVPVNSSNWG